MSTEESVYIHGTTSEEQQRLSKLNELLNNACIEALKVKKGDRILDIGSGLGQFSRRMAKESETKVLGIERDASQRLKAIEFAEEQGEIELAEFRAGDALALPLSTEELGTFDIVFTRFVLEHVKHPEHVVTEMLKAVRPGGRIVVCDDDHASFMPTPTPFGFPALWDAYIRSYDRLGNDPYIGRHLVELLHAAGLKQIRNQLIFFGGCAHEEKFDLVADNLIGILQGAKHFMLQEQLIDERMFAQGIAGLEFWRQQPDAALWYGICWAEGMS